MARKPQSGKMRVPVEYGKIQSVFTDDGGMKRDFIKEGHFWAQRIGVGAADGANLARSIEGVDVSDDITRLWTWVGHPVTTEYVFKINGTMYSILGVNPSDDERMVEYLVVSGLRDTRG